MFVIHKNKNKTFVECFFECIRETFLPCMMICLVYYNFLQIFIHKIFEAAFATKILVIFAVREVVLGEYVENQSCS